jgi:hypothetical protein
METIIYSRHLDNRYYSRDGVQVFFGTRPVEYLYAGSFYDKNGAEVLMWVHKDNYFKPNYGQTEQLENSNGD